MWGMSEDQRTMVELTQFSPDPSKPIEDGSIDVSNLSKEDQEFYRVYGRLPNSAAKVKRAEANKNQFDSADYFMEAENAKKAVLAGGNVRQKSLPPHMRKQMKYYS